MHTTDHFVQAPELNSKIKSAPLTLRLPSDIRTRAEAHRQRLSLTIGVQISLSMAVIHLINAGLTAQAPV